MRSLIDLWGDANKMASGRLSFHMPRGYRPQVQNQPGIGHAGAGGDWKWDPNGINGQGGGDCAPPAGMKWPSCSTMGPQWPHAASDTHDYPAHFYRIQFKRMGGTVSRRIGGNGIHGC
jgi:hypothetical protein